MRGSLPGCEEGGGKWRRRIQRAPGLRRRGGYRTSASLAQTAVVSVHPRGVGIPARLPVEAGPGGGHPPPHSATGGGDGAGYPRGQRARPAGRAQTRPGLSSAALSAGRRRRAAVSVWLSRALPAGRALSEMATAAHPRPALSSGVSVGPPPWGTSRPPAGAAGRPSYVCPRKPALVRARSAASQARAAAGALRPGCPQRSSAVAPVGHKCPQPRVPRPRSPSWGQALGMAGRGCARWTPHCPAVVLGGKKTGISTCW